ncbi:MAG: hypothetical protein P8J50_06930 [Acidimicrobiales bacterium]|jgi:hypothetical protein|nr:hypothetical protein [Acidimicrobiales bacterium]
MWSATPILGVRDVAASVEHFVAVLGFERVATFGIDDRGVPVS